jgi:uncharacterized membrane protein
VAALIFVTLVAIGRALRTLYRRLASWLDGHMGHRAARALGIVVLVIAIVLGVTGLAWRWTLRGLDSSLAVGDLTTPRGIEQPKTPLRSGSAESLIPWDSLGRQGRIFVGEGPDAADISAVSHVRAREPVRIFAGVDRPTLRRNERGWPCGTWSGPGGSHASRSS